MTPGGKIMVGIVAVIGAVVLYGAIHKDPVNSPAQVAADDAKYDGAASSTAPPSTTSTLTAADDNFIGSIRDDGITLANNEAILQAHAVCLYVEPPNGGSIFDAIQQVQQMHSEWTTVTTTHFVDRSIQNYCPDRAPTP